ncbi:MAG: type II toxin-antitoxin system RelE/ParE family toxin [Gammaproteobacteria bacterium]|nr:type II toxin-antitoxin system RelE/ParE family toxin [Gammaproteobacteria bacterium]MBU1656054.1 type II toxin-antitoxin system RelE/ParE family toxin [Gammaproteobacteria bacterium]MBU1961245.1 type II toxin-antitoxin system RelE/ParE family toxin [Gammaproteobacteria bacterium]
MKAVLFAPEALNDLDDIWLYIAQDSIFHADRFIDEQRELCEGKLSMFPNMGSGRGYLAEGVFAFPHGSYMIYYRVRLDALEIIRVMHGSVDVESLFATPFNAGMG